ncbi:MAG: hypothetical protein BWY75_00920 [bacterium ADurb.Bin425]|nr:MAG: hypothetical protein BWY75_00920 [bacterium ADurb.Bin425]
MPSLPSLDLSQTITITTVAFGATLLSSMSGGGSSMITTPVWLMLGFPLPVAISSNTLNGSVWTLIAARNYLRGHQIDKKLLVNFIAIGLLGAYCGTQVIVNSNPQTLQKVFGAFILLLVVITYIKKDFGTKAKPPSLSRLQTALFALPLGFYEAFFGSGNGIFTSVVLTMGRGFLLLEALGYYYLVACAWCLFASTIYVAGGHYDLRLVLPAICGSLSGAWLGSKIGKKYGSDFVKKAFIAAGTILGTKLLFTN